MHLMSRMKTLDFSYWFFCLFKAWLKIQYISYTAWKSNTCCASLDFSKHSPEGQAVCQGYREAIYILEVDSEFELFCREIIYCSYFAIHTSFFFNINYLTERGFLNELDLTKISNDYSTVTTILFNIRSDEGLTLKTPALETLYGGKFTLSTQFLKPNYLVWKTNKGLRGQERLGR